MIDTNFTPLNPDMIPDEKMDIVAVGAHPDDVDANCGGTLAKLAKQGFRIGIVDLTNGEPTPLNEKYRSFDDFDSDYADIRKEHAFASAKELGVKARMILDLPNRYLIDSFEARCKLATVFRKWKPKIVFQMYYGSHFDNPDHDSAKSIIEFAKHFSRYTKWDKYMINLPPWRISGYPIYYAIANTVPLHPVDNHGELTTFHIDITQEIDQKIKALQCFKSQFGGKDISERLKDWDSFEGIPYTGTIRKLYLESFLTMRPIILSTDGFKFFFFDL